MARSSDRDQDVPGAAGEAGLPLRCHARPLRVTGEAGAPRITPRHKTEQTMAKQMTNGDASHQAILRESKAWPMR